MTDRENTGEPQPDAPRRRFGGAGSWIALLIVGMLATVLVYETDFPAGNRPEAIAAYLSRTLVVRDAADRVINLTPSQISSEGDRLRIALRGKAIEGLRNGRIAATLLHERFDDQVNVVEARIDGRRRTLVFLPGEASQGLP